MHGGSVPMASISFLARMLWLLNFIVLTNGFLQQRTSYNLPIHSHRSMPIALPHSQRVLTYLRERNWKGTAVESVRDRTYTNSDEDFELILDDFDEILQAVQIFQKIYGNCEIPSRFEVPSDPRWPLTLQGLRLGRRLEKLQTSHDFMQKHPDKVRKLASIGWDPNSMNLVEDWSTLVECLEVYKQLFGDLRIPAKFAVPDEEPWPRMARGIKLGVRVAAIRSAGRYVKENPARKAELDRMGFEWRIRDNSQRSSGDDTKFQQIVAALKLYKTLVSEDLGVPAKFVVPESEEWPRELWSLKLGYQVNLIRNDEKFVKARPDRVQQLSELGFSWLKTDRVHDGGRRFEVIYTALTVYKQVYGDLFVPQHFVVPSAAPWPEVTWGVKLGTRVTAIRAQSTFVSNSPERRAMLDALGFCWEMRAEINRRARSQQLLQRPEPSPDMQDQQQGYQQLQSNQRGQQDRLPLREAVEAHALPAPPAKRGRPAKDSMRGRDAPQELARDGYLLGGELEEEDGEIPAELLTVDAKENAQRELDELASFERELQRVFGARLNPSPPVRPSASAPATTTVSRAPSSTAGSASRGATRADRLATVGTTGTTGTTVDAPGNPLSGSAQDWLSHPDGTAGDGPEDFSAADNFEDDPIHSLPIPDCALIPSRTYDAAEGHILPFDATNMFQPEAYRETAAATILEHMLSRETSSDPAVRQNAHFEGKLTPQAFCELMAKPIDPADIAYMKSEGYRIMDFGRFNFADVVQALQVYRAHHGHVDVPQNYVITDRVVREMSNNRHDGSGGDGSEDGVNAEWAQFQAEAREADAYWTNLIEASSSDSAGPIALTQAPQRKAKAPGRDAISPGARPDEVRTGLSHAVDPSPPLPQYDVRYIGMPLGEAVASLRDGDVDGLEDPVRRPLLDALGFEWGDKSRHQRFRFMPMMLGLKIYRHLYGFPLVKTDFVVPDEPQWPYWMAGMPLGEWAAVARVQQAMLREHYPQRVDMLNAMEFLWWIPPARTLPQRYYAPVE